MYKRLYFIGTGAYLVMLVLSVLFYKERIIFLDTAFTLFHIIKDNFFSIQVYRFGDVFSQLLPVLAVKASLPLNVVIMSYSVGFMTYYFACYFICGSLLKQYDLALTILLLNLLFVSETFYWITSQLPECLALLAVILAFIKNRPEKILHPWNFLILFLSLVTLAFFHPLSLIVLLYAVIFFKQRGSLFTSKRLLYAAGGVFILAILVKATLFHTPYERNSLSGMKNFIKLFPDYFTIYSNKRFLSACISKYYWIPVLFVGTIIFYSNARKWKELLIFLSFFLGYLLLINVSYPGASTPLFYIESMYMPLAIFLALPLIFELLPLLDRKKLALPTLTVIVFTGCARLYTAHPAYTARLNLERRYIEMYGERKVIVKAPKADADTLQMCWGSAYECLFLSQSERNRPASIIIDEDPSRMPWPVNDKGSLLVNWDVFLYSKINRRYFNFKDTVTTYLIEARPQ